MHNYLHTSTNCNLLCTALHVYVGIQFALFPCFRILSISLSNLVLLFAQEMGVAGAEPICPYLTRPLPCMNTLNNQKLNGLSGNPWPYEVRSPSREAGSYSPHMVSSRSSHTPGSSRAMRSPVHGSARGSGDNL